MLLTMVDFFSNYYNVIVMIQNHLLPEEKSREKFYYPNPDIHVREWMGVISQVDYFIGCDSSGQHIARSLGTPGSIIMGGTSPTNFSYNDYFQVFCKKYPVYSPMRISLLQSDLADRLNSENMKYNSSEILEICEKIKIKVDAVEM